MFEPSTRVIVRIREVLPPGFSRLRDGMTGTVVDTNIPRGVGVQFDRRLNDDFVGHTLEGRLNQPFHHDGYWCPPSCLEPIPVTPLDTLAMTYIRKEAGHV